MTIKMYILSSLPSIIFIHLLVVHFWSLYKNIWTIKHCFIWKNTRDHTKKLEIPWFEILVLYTFVRINVHTKYFSTNFLGFFIIIVYSFNQVLGSLVGDLTSTLYIGRYPTLETHKTHDLAALSLHFFHDYRNISQE